MPEGLRSAEGRALKPNRPKALLRFYAISAAIVFTIALIVAAYVNREQLRLKIASVYASVPPKAAQPDAQSKARAHVLGLEAPWVLSALPECLRQTYVARGTRSYVASKLPAGFTMQPAGTDLQYGDCTIETRANDVLVRRGTDRFHVPAPAQVFRSGNSIALMYESGPRAVLRIYQPAPSL